MEKTEQISELVSRFDKDKNFYQSTNYNETQLRSDFLDPLFEILGWDIHNKSGKSTSNREVLLEESLKANASTHSKKPDYTFRLFSGRKFFLEAKKPSIKIESDKSPSHQVRKYGYSAGLKISALSNFEYLLIYDTSVPVDNSDPCQKALIKSYHYTEYENKLDEILSLLGRESVYNGNFDKEWASITPNIQPKPIDVLFLEQINRWRIELANEIHKVDSSIPVVQLTDIVQSYINKLLFLRVCEDRNIEKYEKLLSIAKKMMQKDWSLFSMKLIKNITQDCLTSFLLQN